VLQLSGLEYGPLVTVGGATAAEFGSGIFGDDAMLSYEGYGGQASLCKSASDGSGIGIRNFRRGGHGLGDWRWKMGDGGLRSLAEAKDGFPA
jgi:hypothetical protein